MKKYFSVWILSVLVLYFICIPSLFAQSQEQVSKRYALVIGNSNYTELGKLKNPVNDATDMATILKDLGFEVDLLLDGDLVTMEESVVRLGSRLSGSQNAIGLFFYAGHGVQSNGINYLIPADARIPSEAYLKTKALAAQAVLDTIQNAKNRLNLIVLDACRDNPYGWARSGTRGLTIVGTQPSGSIVVYATSAGSVAQDGSGRNGIFTGELLKNLKTPNLEVGELFRRTGLAVQDATKGLQNPAVYSQFFGTAYLNDAGPTIHPENQYASLNGGKPADLMVRSSEAGAEVLVEGLSKGKSPLLVQGLPSERPLKIEVRTATSAGFLNLTLKPGELREVTVSLAPLTGNLVILSEESAVEVVLDGQNRGPLGSGLLRDIPIGDHRLELVGQNLYFSKIVGVKPEGTVQVSAQVLPVGRIAIKAPSECQISVLGQAYTARISGSAILANVPTGTYRLEASGKEYIDVWATITVKKGFLAEWEPYTTGVVVFEVSPAGANFILPGKEDVIAHGRLEGIEPGTYTAILRKAGYKDAEVELNIGAGRVAAVKASMTILKPGAISIGRLGTEIALSVDGETRKGEAGAGGELIFKNIASGRPVSIHFLIPGAESKIPGKIINLGEGESLRYDLPVGRFNIPWLAQNANVSIAGSELPKGDLLGFRSPLLPEAIYPVVVSGKYRYESKVQIRGAQEVELPGYRDFVLTAMSAERQAIEKSIASNKSKTGWGVVSLGTGIFGAAGAAAVYYLGNQAGTAYANAVDTASAQAARAQIELYGNLFPVAVGIGGIGLGLSPLLLFGGPDPEALRRSIDSLDQQINALKI